MLKNLRTEGGGLGVEGDQERIPLRVATGIVASSQVRAPFGSPLREATTTLPSAVCCPGIVGEAATILTASSPDRT